MKNIVTKEILDIYDKYEGDFGLLDEPWASKKDRKKVSLEQSKLLCEYIDQLHGINVEKVSNEIKSQTIRRIKELENVIDSEVVRILKTRIRIT